MYRHRRERFFLWVGLEKPHPEWYAPAEYHRLYDPAQVPLPETLREPSPEIPQRTREKLRVADRFTDEQVRGCIAAYWANVTYLDAKVGELPAERAELLAAGVHMLLLTQPVGYVADAAGRLSGVRVVRVRLGRDDATGRRRPVPIAGSESVLPVDLAVEALGEGLDAALEVVLPGVELAGDVVKVRPGTFATSRAGVFAAGDLVNGGTTVARALAEGRDAGRAMGQCAAGTCGSGG